MPFIVLHSSLRNSPEGFPLQDSDHLLNLALAYWESLCEGDDMPERDRFEPIGAVEVLPHTIFARTEIDQDTGDMTDGEVMMVGVNVRERLRSKLLGKRFLDVFGDPSKSDIWNAYDAAQKNRRPVFLYQNYIGPAEKVGGTREVVLPFKGIGPDHNFVLVVIQFMTVDGDEDGP